MQTQPTDTKANTMMVTLNKVKPNPYRDFDLDPLNAEVVAKMKASISDMEFWGGLAVREVADGYELAFGHHRLEALKQLGRTSEDLKIVAFDDDMMVKAMVAENALQRGGDTTAHLDAVQAICSRIIYKVLSCKGDAKKLSKILLSLSDKAAKDLIARMDRGGEVGYQIVLDFITPARGKPPMSTGAVREALDSLRDSGRFRVIHEVVREKISSERREEAEQAKREKMARAEIKRREDEAEQAQEKAAQYKKDSAPKKGVSEAYDIKVSQVFDSDSQSKAFREIVTSTGGKEFIPLDQQLPMAAKVKEKIKEDKQPITAERIKQYANNVLIEAAKYKRNAQQKMEEEVASEAAAKRWNEMVLSVSKLATAAEGLNTQMKKCGNGFVRKTDHVTFMNMLAHANKLAEETAKQFDKTTNVVSTQA